MTPAEHRERSSVRSLIARLEHGKRSAASGGTKGSGVVMEALEARVLLSGSDPLITEFMADNTKTLKDYYNEYSDCIEIHNPGAS